MSNSSDIIGFFYLSQLFILKSNEKMIFKLFIQRVGTIKKKN